MPNVPFDERSKPGLFNLCITGVRELGGCLVQRGYKPGRYNKGSRSSHNRGDVARRPASTPIGKALGKTEICRCVKQEIRILMAFARCSHKGNKAANLTEINVPPNWHGPLCIRRSLRHTKLRPTGKEQPNAPL